MTAGGRMKRMKKMDGKMKEVNYSKYCRCCKYRKLEETEDPCNECLSEPGRIDSRKPRHFEKGETHGTRLKREP